MEAIRAFIAIDLPADIKTALAVVVAEISKELRKSSVRWVKPQNIHLTLRFLGDIALEELPDIMMRMDHVVTDHEAFELQLAGVGCFPSPRRPRVVWVGVTGAMVELMSLQASLEDLVVESGWKRENRRFHPHLTIGRVKDSKEVGQREIQWGKIIQHGIIPVNAIHLIESTLKPSGAIYTIRHTSQLRKGI